MVNLFDLLRLPAVRRSPIARFHESARSTLPQAKRFCAFFTGLALILFLGSVACIKALRLSHQFHIHPRLLQLRVDRSRQNQIRKSRSAGGTRAAAGNAGWQVKPNRAMFLSYERSLQPDLVGAGIIVPIAGLVGGRDPGPWASD
jgi:hypothetical protein